MTAGKTSVAGVQRTTTPLDPMYEVTLSGAFGAEYVTEFAEGTVAGSINPAARIEIAIRLNDFAERYVLFIGGEYGDGQASMVD